MIRDEEQLEALLARPASRPCRRRAGFVLFMLLLVAAGFTIGYAAFRPRPGGLVQHVDHESEPSTERVLLGNASASWEDCVAPVDGWGPVCRSGVWFVSSLRDALLEYHVEPIQPTASHEVYCRLFGTACHAYGAACCPGLHPRVEAGFPSGMQRVLWADVAEFPAIQCRATQAPGVALRWSWRYGGRAGLACSVLDCTSEGC